jgi:hypothetical protein
MRDSGCTGGGGFFVGLDPDAARSLAAALSSTAGRAGSTAARLSGMLAEAGADAGGCSTPTLLRRVEARAETEAQDLRWRATMLAADNAGGGMVFGVLAFPSAAAARAAGRRHAQALERALDRHVYGPDEHEDDALEDYLSLLRATAVSADDPAWSGGLIDELGDGGLSNALFFTGFEVEGDTDQLRDITGPVFTALATALRHRTADPQIRTELLRWPTYDLALVLSLAPAETGFLTTAARQILVESQLTPDRFDDPNEREYVFVLEALADNAEAAHRVVTGTNSFGHSNVTSLLLPMEILASGPASAALGRTLEAALVEHPDSLRELNAATATTEDVIELVGRLGYAMDEVDPQLNRSLASLLRPHLEAIAVIGARDNGLEGPTWLDVELPPGRRALDVDADALHEFLGAAMQQDAGVAEVQFLLAAYSQRPEVQANRIPLLDDRPVSHLDPFAADSLRIAGLIGLVGHGLDEAGKDEESVTRLLTGALNFAAGRGASLIPASRHPALWLAQRGVRYLAGERIKEVEEWLQTREPVEGEVGVDEFLTSYLDTTESSLRDHIAADPELSALSEAEQEALIRRARYWAETTVGGGLRETYAELASETAGE